MGGPGPAGRFPWEAALAYGLGCLRLHPQAFWALSLVELVALTGGGVLPDADMARSRLASMMAQFPDGDGDG